MNCTECDAPIEGRRSNALTCSEPCRKARQARLKAYTRRIARNGLADYPVTIPGTPEHDEERRARDDYQDGDSDLVRLIIGEDRAREDRAERALRRRPRPPAEVFDPPTGVPGESRPGFRPSLVAQLHQRADSGDLEAKKLLDYVDPPEPKDRLYGLAEELAKLGYASAPVPTVSSPVDVFGQDGWSSLSRDTEPGPEHPWWRLWPVPKDGLAVGRTGDISRGQGVTDPVPAAARESLSKPVRWENWCRDDIEDYNPTLLMMARTPVGVLEPFVWTLAA